MTEEKISKLNWDFVDQFEAFIKDLAKESDRAAVILGTARIEELLYQLLGATLIPGASGDDELLDGDRPLSTLSARINVAYRLGLITAEYARALHLLRKIRNAFAHDMTSMTLNSGAHRDRAREFVAGLRSEEIFKVFMEDYFEDKWEVSNEVRTATAMCALRLERAVSHARRLDSSRAVSLVPWTGIKVL